MVCRIKQLAPVIPCFNASNHHLVCLHVASDCFEHLNWTCSEIIMHNFNCLQMYNNELSLYTFVNMRRFSSLVSLPTATLQIVDCSVVTSAEFSFGLPIWGPYYEVFDVLARISIFFCHKTSLTSPNFVVFLWDNAIYRHLLSFYRFLSVLAWHHRSNVAKKKYKYGVHAATSTKLSLDLRILGPQLHFCFIFSRILANMYVVFFFVKKLASLVPVSLYFRKKTRSTTIIQIFVCASLVSLVKYNR